MTTIPKNTALLGFLGSCGAAARGKEEVVFSGSWMQPSLFFFGSGGVGVGVGVGSVVGVGVGGIGNGDSE